MLGVRREGVTKAAAIAQAGVIRYVRGQIHGAGPAKADSCVASVMPWQKESIALPARRLQ